MIPAHAKVLLAACALGAVPAVTNMWGEEGHRIVCGIAARRLSTEAQALVGSVLGTEAKSLPGVCTWADSVRGSTHQHTAAYHYVNLPRDAKVLDLTRDCADEQKRCVVWAIQNFARVLADGTKPLEERREALKFVVHFVGDLHQPLHVSFADDLGGNQTRVEFFGDAGRPGRPRDLHSVWDTRVLMRAGAQWEAWADRLSQSLTGEDVRRWETLDVSGWANESFALTTSFVYGQLPADGRINDAYYLPALKHSETQMLKGGVRLAYLLNRIAAKTLAFPGVPGTD